MIGQCKVNCKKYSQYFLQFSFSIFWLNSLLHDLAHSSIDFRSKKIGAWQLRIFFNSYVVMNCNLLCWNIVCIVLLCLAGNRKPRVHRRSICERWWGSTRLLSWVRLWRIFILALCFDSQQIHLWQRRGSPVAFSLFFMQHHFAFTAAAVDPSLWHILHS